MALDPYLQKYKNKLPYNDGLIPESDYTSITYKKQIREIFNENYFFEFSDYLKTLDSPQQINQRIEKLKKINIQGYNNLFAKVYSLGPGERVLYYLVDSAVLGGGSSAGVDITVNGSNQYEIKSADITADNKFAYGFEVSRSLDVFSIIDSVYALCQQNNISSSRTEIKTSSINALKLKMPKEYAIIERKFAILLGSNYFKNELIILNNNKSKNYGLVEFIGKVNTDNITIERITRGVVRPKIKIR
jgi:hypothetical protein